MLIFNNLLGELTSERCARIAVQSAELQLESLRDIW